jgi:hypothetical protein
LDLYQLPFTPGLKTIALFESLLAHWSVAQTYNFIWRGSKEAAAYSTQVGVTRPNAANTVINWIQQKADRARADNWVIHPYRRDTRRPQTIVSKVLFDTVLQIGEDGFNQIPSAIIRRLDTKDNNPST